MSAHAHKPQAASISPLSILTHPPFAPCLRPPAWRAVIVSATWTCLLFLRHPLLTQHDPLDPLSMPICPFTFHYPNHVDSAYVDSAHSLTLSPWSVFTWSSRVVYTARRCLHWLVSGPSAFSPHVGGYDLWMDGASHSLPRVTSLA